jgi:ribosome-binding ATPase
VRIISWQIEFVDIAGIVKGASEGAGLGNKFLTNIRQTDAIVHVVRCFVDDDIIHVDGNVDPLRDVEIISLELILADLAQIEKKLEKVSRDFLPYLHMFCYIVTLTVFVTGFSNHENFLDFINLCTQAKKDKKNSPEELVALEKVNQALMSGKAARQASLTVEELDLVKSLMLLTLKPVIYAANVADSDLATGNELSRKLTEFAKSEGNVVVIVSAQVTDHR